MIPQATHNQVIALTGSIGTGKSTVGGILRELGAVVIEADVLARQAVAPGSPALQRIAESFGPQVLQEDGSLDREKVAEIIFADPQRRRQLEDITHPVIRSLSEQELQKALDSGAPLVVYDCPLLFEAGLDALRFRAIVVVAADETTAVKRIMARDGISESEARQRVQTQLPISEKCQRADYVVDNAGSLEALRKEVRKLYRKLAS